jgi:hypothetical protein
MGWKRHEANLGGCWSESIGCQRSRESQAKQIKFYVIRQVEGNSGQSITLAFSVGCFVRKVCTYLTKHFHPVVFQHPLTTSQQPTTYTTHHHRSQEYLFHSTTHFASPNQHARYNPNSTNILSSEFCDHLTGNSVT